MNDDVTIFGMTMPEILKIKIWADKNRAMDFAGEVVAAEKRYLMAAYELGVTKRRLEAATQALKELQSTTHDTP